MRPGRYQVHHGRGERRWADGGEIAWHDITPMQYDVAVGRPMLAWEESAGGGAFQSAYIAREDGAGFVARYDSGVERKLEVGALRERWTLPLRALCLVGDYEPATVLEALGGLLRIQFVDGAVRWSLPEELLAEERLGEGGAMLAAGSHVAVLHDWPSAQASVDAPADETAAAWSGIVWKRAQLLGDVTGPAGEVATAEPAPRGAQHPRACVLRAPLQPPRTARMCRRWRLCARARTRASSRPSPRCAGRVERTRRAAAPLSRARASGRCAAAGGRPS